MLAYVVWHWRFDDVEATSYEESSLAFHRALASGDSPGFHGSALFRSTGAPWTPADSDAYEDWYLVDGSWALDGLNDFAVSGARRDSHDRIAAAAQGFIGGLYGLRDGGAPRLDAPQRASWLAKPRELPYADFYEALAPWSGQPGVTLWRRHLVLGPTSEFCLLGPPDLDPPPDFVRAAVELEPVGSER